MKWASIMRGLLGLALMARPNLHAAEISWASDPNATNLTSNGSPMDGGFQFELGVFEGTFTPDLSNRNLWAQNWRPAQRVNYNPITSAFDGSYTVENNNLTFTVGKEAYIWGWRTNASGTQWILFRDSTWTWPDVEELPPSNLSWYAGDATAIIGEINPGGQVLMESAAVTGVASPPTSWLQWQAKTLANELQNNPHDDPDQDGAENLLEFVFGTDPKTANASVATPISFVTVGPDRFLQITIPRRIDHTAALVVEVSSDMQTWHSGPAHTETMADDVAALVVRDRTPLSPATPKRFMRLRAVVP